MNRISSREVIADLPKNLLKKKMDELEYKNSNDGKFAKFRQDLIEMAKTAGFWTVDFGHHKYNISSYSFKDGEIELAYFGGIPTTDITPASFDKYDIEVDVLERTITIR